MPIDLNLVRVLVAIVETGSVSRAAERLGVTQPSATHALNRLRATLDDPLFVRQREGMTPTPAATRLYMHFKDALGSIEQGLAELKSFDPVAAAHGFRIALTDIGGTFFLPGLYQRFRERAPRSTLEVSQLDASRIRSALMSGRVDAAVATDQAAPQLDHLRRHRLFDEHYVCLLRKRHPLARGRLSLERYLGGEHAQVLPQPEHALPDAVLARMGRHRRIALTVPHFSALPAIIPACDLMLTVPKRLVGWFGDQVVAKPLPFAVPSFGVDLFMLDDSGQSAPQRWLCAMLLDVLRTM